MHKITGDRMDSYTYTNRDSEVADTTTDWVYLGHSEITTTHPTHDT